MEVHSRAEQLKAKNVICLGKEKAIMTFKAAFPFHLKCSNSLEIYLL